MGAAFPEMRFLPNHIRFQGPLSTAESEPPSASGPAVSLLNVRSGGARALASSSSKPCERHSRCLPRAGRGTRRIRLHGPPFQVRAHLDQRIAFRAL